MKTRSPETKSFTEFATSRCGMPVALRTLPKTRKFLLTSCYDKLISAYVRMAFNRLLQVVNALNCCMLTVKTCYLHACCNCINNTDVNLSCCYLIKLGSLLQLVQKLYHAGKIDSLVASRDVSACIQQTNTLSQ